MSFGHRKGKFLFVSENMEKEKGKISVGKQALSAVLEKETKGNGIYFCVLKTPGTYSGKRLHESWLRTLCGK